MGLIAKNAPSISHLFFQMTAYFFFVMTVSNRKMELKMAVIDETRNKIHVMRIVVLDGSFLIMNLIII